MASMATAGPVAMSPPVKTPGSEVSKVSSPKTRVLCRVDFSSGSFCRPHRSTSWPMAEMAKSQGSWYSEPATGTGLRRPLASASPSSMRMQVRALSRPFSCDQLGRGREQDQFHSLFQGGVDLHGVGRHLVARAAVQDRHLVGAQPPGGAGGVEGGVAAADHHDLAVDLGLLFALQLPEKIDAAEDAGDRLLHRAGACSSPSGRRRPGRWRRSPALSGRRSRSPCPGPDLVFTVTPRSVIQEISLSSNSLGRRYSGMP